MKKLREYKGVTYRDPDFAWKNRRYDCAAALIADLWSKTENFTDDDHAALMKLKADPYEPTPTLEQVIRKAWKECPTGADVCVYLTESLCDTFPQIDAPGIPVDDEEGVRVDVRTGDVWVLPHTITAADHIAALVSMGAKHSPDKDAFTDWPMLLLPPEMMR